MRTKFVNAKVTDEEYLALSLIGSLEGLNQSETIRWLLREEAGRRGIKTGLVKSFQYHPVPEAYHADHA